MGAIPRSARAAGFRATGADIAPRDGSLPRDFLKDTRVYHSIVFNPPTKVEVNGRFVRAIDRFVRHAFEHAKFKVTFFMEVQQIGAAHWLWDLRPRRLWLINPRPSCPSVEVHDRGEKPGNGTKDFAWITLERGWKGKCETDRLLK